jgi:adenylate cyclase
MAEKSAENSAKKQGAKAWFIVAPARITRSLGIVITLAVCALFLAASLRDFEVPLLDHLELKTYDMRMRALERSPSRLVTIAAIDEQSLARIGRWPWSRSVHAELTRRLDEAGAKVIAFDIFFSEKESAKADAQLARALGATKKTVLGTVFLLDARDARYLGDTGVAAGLKAIGPLAVADAGGRDARPKTHGVLANIPELQASSAYAGHINVMPDSDGIYRRVPLVLVHGDRYFPSFDVQVARAFDPDKAFALNLTDWGVASVTIAGREIPVDAQGQLLVRYRGQAGTTFDRVSVADILDRKADPALLKDRVVLIGGTATSLGDIRATPLDSAPPGVEIRANVIENLLDGRVIERPEWMALVDVILMAFVGLLMVWLLPRFGVSGGGLLAVVLLAAFVTFAVYLFRNEGLWLNLVYPSLLIVLLFAVATLVSYFFTFSEKRYLKLAFQHYVPPAVVEDLVSDAGALRLGGEKRELTVLFSDIRGFTTLSEGLQPEELVKLMNEYFTVMTDLVFAHRGSLDKYIGDAIMAVYGAPVVESDHPALACRSALDMMRALEELQQKWQAAGLPKIGIGVGINTGQVVVGNMGSKTRFNYTVVGDHVNLSSRIEGLNKTYGTSILISEYTYERVKDEFRNVREVDSVKVRGREQPVRLYELFLEGKFTAEFLEEYRAAYSAKRAGDHARAMEMFQKLATSGDPVSIFHADRRGVGEATITSLGASAASLPRA